MIVLTNSLNSMMVYSTWMRILARQKRLSKDILRLLCAFLPRWPRHPIDNSRLPAFYLTFHGSADDMWVIREQRWRQHADIVRLRMSLQDAAALRSAHGLVSAEVHQIPILRSLEWRKTTHNHLIPACSQPLRKWNVRPVWQRLCALCANEKYQKTSDNYKDRLPSNTS